MEEEEIEEEEEEVEERYSVSTALLCFHLDRKSVV